MTTIDALDRFLDGQFHAWNCQETAPKHNRPGPVVTISREPGCGGEGIAQTIAEALGLALYDGSIIEQVARDAHVSEKIVASLDENLRTELEEWLLSCGGDVQLTTHEYLHCLRSILFAVAAHGNAVIVGRGANFILPRTKKTVGLSLVAPLEVRVKNIAQELQVTPEDARKYIDRKDRERLALVRQMAHTDILDATHFHMVINTALVAPATIVQIVKAIIQASR